MRAPVRPGSSMKESAPENLIVAVRKVAAGGRYVTEALAERLATFVAAKHRGPTRSRRIASSAIMKLIASGKTVGEIAREPSPSVKTVSTHRTRILAKMDAKTNAELTHYAVKKSSSSSAPGGTRAAGRTPTGGRLAVSQPMVPLSDGPVLQWRGQLCAYSSSMIRLVVRTRLVALLPRPACCSGRGRGLGRARGRSPRAAARLDAVVLDLNLPGMSGLEVLALLKASPSPPVVVVLTNHPQERDRLACVRGGADFFFDKSHDFDRVVSVVSTAALRS